MRAKWTGIALAIIALYLSPYIFQGQDAPFESHDQLDSNVIWTKLTAESSDNFGGVDAAFPQFMHGQSRNAFAPEFHVITWLFMMFTPFTAWLLNILFIHLTGFFSMYALLRRHFLREPAQLMPAWAVSVCFALLPWWYPGGICIAGLPLVMNAFLNIRKNEASWRDFAALALYALYGWFIHIGIFVIGLFGLLWLRDMFRKRGFQPKFFLGLTVLTFFSLLTEYHTFYDVFLREDFVSHRTEFNTAPLQEPLNFNGLVTTSALFFANGHSSAHALQFPFILIAAALGLVAGLISKAKKQTKVLFLLLCIAGAIAVFRQAMGWGPVMSLIAKYPLIGAFQFDRFYLFYPVIFLLMFFISLSLLWQWNKAGRILATLFVPAQVAWTLFNSYPMQETVRLAQVTLGDVRPTTWRNYYSENLCKTIRDYIGEPQKAYYTASLGLPPDVFQYNGFYTLDGYLPNYDLAYKHRFREIMQDELAEDSKTRNYFDGWGSRCYLFSHEVGFDFRNIPEDTIHDLDYDMASFKDLGGKYLFSARPISNADSIGLKYRSTFSDSASLWTVHLYEAL